MKLLFLVLAAVLGLLGGAFLAIYLLTRPGPAPVGDLPAPALAEPGPAAEPPNMPVAPAQAPPPSPAVIKGPPPALPRPRIAVDLNQAPQNDTAPRAAPSYVRPGAAPVVELHHDAVELPSDPGEREAAIAELRKRRLTGAMDALNRRNAERAGLPEPPPSGEAPPPFTESPDAPPVDAAEAPDGSR